MINAETSTTELIALICAVAVNTLVVLGAWFKFKSELKSKVQQINSYTDVSVTKLNGMLKYLISSFDRPCWLKLAVKENNGIVFRMVELNKMYEEFFHMEREDYIGKTDLEAGWDHETAQIFHENDLTVWASGKPQNFIEKINGKNMTFRKIRVETESGEAKGIFGYCVDDIKNPQIERN